jgi:hypothetical protein
VSKYLLQLPNKDKLEEFIITEMKKWKQWLVRKIEVGK